MHGDLEIGVSLSRLQAQVDTLYYCEVLYNIRQSSQALKCYQMQVHMPNIQGGQTITKCQSLEQRKVYCRTKQWDKWLVWEKPEISRGVSAKHFKGFLGGAVVKNLPANAGDTRNSGLIPGLGRAPEGGNGNPLQYSCLENVMDREAWWATVQGVAKSRTQLSDFTINDFFPLVGWMRSQELDVLQKTVCWSFSIWP